MQKLDPRQSNWLYEIVSLDGHLEGRGASMGHLIRNCRFRFKCGMTWDMMDATDDPVVRHCGGCERDVHFCATDQELARAMLENHCVAIPSEGTVYENLEDLPQMAVGMMDVEYDTDDPDLPK